VAGAPLDAEIELKGGIETLAAEAWDALAGAANPFVSHAFLEALEASGSAAVATGWQPLHLALEGDGRLLGAVPLYAKSHSFGEYVFDWGWADAYERAGGRYYPKLQASVPFSPVPGPRLLGGDGDPGVRRLLARALRETADRLDVSSAHVTFCREDEAEALAEEGFLRRRGIQFHWHNRGYESFDHFLDSLKSSRRKVIRRERREVEKAGIRLEVLTGDDLEPAHLDTFYPFYLATVDKRWGAAYLTNDFFRRLALAMPERIVLVLARRASETVAAALNLRGSDTLYGRVWGALEEVPFLHFEACYYQAIDFAIRHGIAHVEAGAQGMHKLQRGYEPTFTQSAHYIRDPALRQPVERFLKQEHRDQRRQLEELRELLPFRDTDPAG